MPLIGLGTYSLDDVQNMANAISEIGYRFIDTGSFYKNEEIVGQAIKVAIETGKVTREELFVVTKVWIDETEDVDAAIKRSLTKLGLDYVDLYLVHWPIAVKTVEEASEGKEAKYERINIPMYKVWEQMEATIASGQAKSIGVSNFGVQLIWDLLSYAKIQPAVNEIEIHPLLT